MTEREKHLLDQLEHLLAVNRDFPKEDTFSALHRDLKAQIGSLQQEFAIFRTETQPMLDWFTKDQTFREQFMLRAKTFGVVVATVFAAVSIWNLISNWAGHIIPTHSEITK